MSTLLTDNHYKAPGKHVNFAKNSESSGLHDKGQDSADEFDENSKLSEA